jgi:LytR cell envelope-related transcriptional attenuator
LEKWLDLLTPSAAALALLLAIALIVQTVRHGRSVRRLESRLAEREGAAARVSLDRLTQLQRRAGTSTGMNESTRDSPRLPPLGNIAAVLAVLALVGGTSWYLFVRDGDSGTAQSTTTGRTVPSKTTTNPKSPSSNTQVPATAPDLEQPKSAYTILVLNGSGVAGAAANTLPIVESKGWNTTKPDNASSSTEATSFVMYLADKEAIADNLAIDLNITKKLPVDGVTITQDISAVDAIVVVGKDLAGTFSP